MKNFCLVFEEKPPTLSTESLPEVQTCVGEGESPASPHTEFPAPASPRAPLCQPETTGSEST